MASVAIGNRLRGRTRALVALLGAAVITAGVGVQATTSVPAVAVTRGWIDTTNRNAVLNAYHATFDPAEPAANWNGNVATCQAGTISDANRAAALSRVNWYRDMAGVLDGVTEDSGFTANAQQAALMVSANNQLNHNPPMTATCFTAAGLDGSQHSNLYLNLSGVTTVDGFIADTGTNNTTVGHREWILDPTQVRMGVGSITPPSTHPAQALYVIDSANDFPTTQPATREPNRMITWPPPGFVPNDKIFARWSLQRDGADFSAANVTVTVGGNPVTTSVENRGNVPTNTKPSSTFVFTPTLPAFPSNADLAIQVSITGIAGSGVPTSYSWTTTAIPPTAVATTTHAVADFDGNGTTDISVYRPATGQWFVQGQSPVSFGSPGDVPVAADYDGNGSSDIAVFRPSSGGWFRNGAATTFFGLNGDIPVPADYDGNGTADIAVFRPSSGGWYRNGAVTTFFGLNGDIPVPGDYNGDHLADIAVFRPSVGGWYRNGAATTFFGLSGDIPVPGDYNGDGTTDIAVFRPSTGGWYVQGQAPVFLGLSGDIPAPGDYDGTGTTDMAVFRPSTGQWFIQGQGPVAYGINGDRPLPLPSAIRQAFFP